MPYKFQGKVFICENCEITFVLDDDGKTYECVCCGRRVPATKISTAQDVRVVYKLAEARHE